MVARANMKPSRSHPLAHDDSQEHGQVFRRRGHSLSCEQQSAHWPIGEGFIKTGCQKEI